MLPRDDFNTLLAEKGTLIIDGALATELETRGHNLDHALWSAIVLRDSPDSIRQVHLDYYLAGADIAITASYQASTQGLKDHFGLDDVEAADVIKQSVQLAQQARDEAYRQDVARTLLVAGSVGPYGAYLADGSEYRGDYERTKEEFQAFHRPRIQALVDGGIDLLAIETMPKLEEIEAVLELLATESPRSISWLSCTMKDFGHLSDGTSVEALFKMLSNYPDQLVAIGINCVPTDIVQASVEQMRSLTDLPLVCYPNSGEIWDAQNHKWLGKDSDTNVEDEALRWKAAGAKLIGGCCRTGPRFVQRVSKALAKERD
ncbi:AdoMet-homocysteine methyltransferase [Extremus antarcticus]|uniref:AdoMet-homocysteine methyltransferase n=1 Tax=Extremus antarcticus TaxID=702011 RepID=A0AAJ0GEZ7_9PEZI|nr:AdoMet-homocysteine methyltransferase [Extremus antarcticus]